MKKILLVTDNAYTYSGREKIFSFMNKVYAQKNEVSIFSLYGSGESCYSYEGCREFLSLNGKRFKMLRLAQYIKKGRFDYVFIVSMGKLSTFFSIFIPFIGRKEIKYVSCEHVSYESLGTIKGWLKLVALKRFDKVVVLTDRDKGLLQNLGLRDVSLIRNPIFRKETFKSKCSNNAIAVGRLNKQKNFIELLEIWSLFIKKNPLWTLKIFGDGEERDNLERYISNEGLSDSVKLMGRVDNIEEFYLDSDICLMTSLYEGLPLALLEAKSYSVPIIAYDCPTGPAEIINDSVDGYLIKMGDKDEFVNKLSHMANNTELTLSMSNSCKNTLGQFSPSKVIEAWNDIII